MIAHGHSRCVGLTPGGTGSMFSGPAFHVDPIDEDDARGPLNPGSRGDISVFLSSFRSGVASEPWAEAIDASLIDFVTAPGFAGIIVLYSGRYIGIAHVDDRVSPPRVTLSDMHAAFMRAVKSMVGIVAR